MEPLHFVKRVQIQSFFSSVFSCIRAEYREIRSISPHLVRMGENTDQKKLRIWTLFTQCYPYYINATFTFFAKNFSTFSCCRIQMGIDKSIKTHCTETLREKCDTFQAHKMYREWPQSDFSKVFFTEHFLATASVLFIYWFVRNLSKSF